MRTSRRRHKVVNGLVSLPLLHREVAPQLVESRHSHITQTTHDRHQHVVVVHLREGNSGRGIEMEEG